MIWKCHGISRFHFYLLFINNGIRDQLDEEDFRRCYGNFFWKCQSESTWSQLCSKFFINYEFFLNSQLRGTQTTAIERHLTIENFTDIDQHRSWPCTKAFNLFLYEYDYSLCLTQAYILNLTKYWSNNFSHSLLAPLLFDILCILKFMQYLYIFCRRTVKFWWASKLVFKEVDSRKMLLLFYFPWNIRTC